MARTSLMAERRKRVAIIGAGPAGLSQLKAFQSAGEKGAEIPDIVCFEKQSDCGGQWIYSWRTGIDENGEAVHSSMYRDLWINGPVEINEYADYPIETHFGRAVPSYAPRPAILDYVRGRAEKAGLRKWVRFNSAVRMVTFNEESNIFTVSVLDRARDIMYSEDFDHIVVATGHFSTPNVPDFEGIGNFKGRLVHSHDLRDVFHVKEKDVLIVGGSYSAEDVACQCYKFGAKSITISYRSKPTGCIWPTGVMEIPQLEKVDRNGRTCHFKDGSSRDVDAIFLCTGYVHDFPFLAEGLRLRAKNRMWPLGLYEGVVLESNPRVFYLGMQAQFHTFNLFEVQAYYARDVIMKRLSLPSAEEMAGHSQEWRKREEEAIGKNSVVAMVHFQSDYVTEVVSLTDCPLTVEAIDGMRQFGIDWEQHRAQGVMSYRDHAFRSTVTGKVAPMHKTPWMTEFDDSLENYLASSTPNP